MTRTQIYLTEDQKLALRRMAAEHGSNVSDLVRAAIDNLLANERVDWGARFDSFRKSIEEHGPEITEEDFAAAAAEVKAARKARRKAAV